MSYDEVSKAHARRGGQDTTRAPKEGSLVLTNHSRTKTSSNQSHLLRAATKRPVGSSAPSLPDRKYLMRTTRENPSEARMAIMRDPDQPWQPTRGKAKAQANQEQSYLAFSPPGHRSGHWPVKHSSSTQIQIGFFTLFREMCKLCSLLARARAFFFSFSLLCASSSATSTRTARPQKRRRDSI